MSQTVAVVGAGLVGCVAALGLQKQGYEVKVYESREDPRLSKNEQLRSINLAVSDRGINALEYIDTGIAKRVLENVIPMKGRMIHHLDESCESQKYDMINDKGINSIDRGLLNEILINELEEKGVEVYFKKKLTKLEIERGASKEFTENKDIVSLKFHDGSNDDIVHVDFVIGADGTYSKVRQELQKLIMMDFKQEYINCGYLELSIDSDKDQGFKIDPNHLHIWPRDKFMLIALPNSNGSFTSTFFAPWEIFDILQTDEDVLTFFKQKFPDALKLITKKKLLYAFNNHPRGRLLSLSCSSYHFEDKVMIIGDAAHSMVPFYGQGMNCGFEDVYVLLNLLKDGRTRMESFEQYSQTRHQDLEAIIELAKENYKEMSHKVTSRLFLLKKNIDFILTKLFKDRWIPLYTMVSFRADIKYSDAVKRSMRQDSILKMIQYLIITVTGVFGLKLIQWLKRR